MSVLLPCQDDGRGRCSVHGKAGKTGPELKDRKGGTPSCKFYFAQAANSIACYGCEGLVPTHLQFTFNPEVIKGLSEGLLERPRVDPAVTTVFSQGMPGGDRVLCEVCAEKAQSFVNNTTDHVGKIAFKGGQRQLVPVFVNPAALAAVERRANEQIGRMVDGIRSGAKFSWAKPQEINGEFLTPCAVGVNMPLACSCGGWHDWRNMWAILQYRQNKIQAFALGPACAETIRTVRPDTNFFNGSYADAMAFVLEEQRREREGASHHRSIEEDDFSFIGNDEGEPLQGSGWGGASAVPVDPSTTEEGAPSSSRLNREEATKDAKRPLPARIEKPPKPKGLGKTAKKRLKEQQMRREATEAAAASAPKKEEEKPMSRADRKAKAHG